MMQTRNERPLPPIGLGTLELQGAPGVAAVRSAIDLGYRLLDTAFIYDNEGAVGQAVRTSSVAREEIVVSTKLPGRAQDHDRALRYVEESLYRSGLDRLDLVLIHWPNPRVGRYVEAWQALVQARERGLVREIGVSNFLPQHLDHLIEATGVVPIVNQIEAHPYFPQHALRAANAERGVLTEAWSPLGRGTDLLQNPVVRSVAATQEVSAAQVLLAWSIGAGMIPLPRAAQHNWQAENLAAVAVELTPQEVADLDALARPDGRVSGQDPATHEEF